MVLIVTNNGIGVCMANSTESEILSKFESQVIGVALATGLVTYSRINNYTKNRGVAMSVHPAFCYCGCGDSSASF